MDDQNRKQVKIVLAGAGGYGAHYAADLLNRRQENVQLAAVADPIARRSPVWQQISQIPCYDDLETCLEQVKADAVIVSSPIQYHKQQVATALEHGAQVLCEKPLCATLEQGKKVVSLSEQTGLHVAVGFQWSFHPVILAAKKDVINGLYGKPETFRTIVHWPRSLAYYQRNNWAGRLRDSAGLPVYDSVINNATAHYLHNMLFFLGQSPDEAAMPDQIEGRLWRGQPIENYDTAFVKMKKDLPDQKPVELLMIASHSGEQERLPQIEMRFSQGRLYMEGAKLIGERYAESASGVSEIINYGLTQGGEDVARKTDALIRAVLYNEKPVCHARTACPHLAVIDWLQKHCLIEQIPQSRISVKEEQGSKWYYMPGLDQLIDQLADTFQLPDGFS